MYLFSADNYKGRLELLEYIEIGINRFLTYNSLRSLRVFYLIASRLILLLVETGFSLRRRGVVAIDRIVFISNFLYI